MVTLNKFISTPAAMKDRCRKAISELEKLPYRITHCNDHTSRYHRTNGNMFAYFDILQALERYHNLETFEDWLISQIDNVTRSRDEADNYWYKDFFDGRLHTLNGARDTLELNRLITTFETQRSHES